MYCFWLWLFVISLIALWTEIDIEALILLKLALQPGHFFITVLCVTEKENAISNV